MSKDERNKLEHLVRRLFFHVQKTLFRYQKQITVLTGMRRTGKTISVKQLIPDSIISQKYYFDLF